MREKRSKCHEKRQRTHRRSRRFVHRLEGRWLRSEVQVRGGEVGSLYKGDTFAATTIPVHNKTSVRETRETYGRTVVVTMTRDEEMAKEEKRRPLWLCCTSRPVPRKFTFLQLDYLLHMSLPVVRLVPRYLHNAVLLLYMYLLHLVYHTLAFLLANISVFMGVLDALISFIAVFCYGPLLRLRLLCGGCSCFCCFCCFCPSWCCCPSRRRRCCCCCHYCCHCCEDISITLDQSQWRRQPPCTLKPNYYMI
nr:uncharacterized protein LOC128694082 isoform X1 [Cherax quadricarinatus]XP_053640040.1 uncharacterized protein LOC128694082 isoform X1 [Cherax quadricarinatus]